MADTSNPELWRSIVVDLLDAGDLKGVANSIAGGLEDWIQGRATTEDLRELRWGLDKLIEAASHESSESSTG
jgi:hypothetical protein